MDSTYRSGFIAIIGKPNVGKSTLVNRLVQDKLSIISPKPQTTRRQIKGIISDEQRQLVFLDTPGYLKPRYELHNRMLKYIEDSLQGADVIMFVTDSPGYPTDYDREMLLTLKRYRAPRICILNKIDLTSPAQVELQLQELAEHGFEKLFPVSALLDDNFNLILDTLTNLLPFSPPFYDTDQLSDLPQRFFVQEIIMEQIFLNFREEIPYSSTVVVENFQETEKAVEIYAHIWVERKTQKPIILGKNGEKIKAVRLASEKEIYRLLGKSVKLQLWVKIKPRWRYKKNALKEFGYH
ncbi:MAG: GTPase Era [Candidatus Cloacimonetes bacterium]|nr:GTPase Era [Candidatus Cloacimonadota bacterium]